jgi:hypothetical protein
MRRMLAGLVLGVIAVSAQAQSGSQSTPGATPLSDANRPNPSAPTQSGGTAAPGQPATSERGSFIAPVVDIRIQGEGISLPKERREPSEKPPAK